MTDKKTDPYAATGTPKMKSGRALLKRFKPFPGNPRLHPKAEIEMLAEILRLRGADQPIVVDEKWVILKGHGRREAAEIAGMEDFPYVQRLGLTETEKTAIRIEDNSIPLLAGWDKTLLSTQLAQLKTDGYDMGLLGFGESQLVHFMTEPAAPAAFQAIGEDVAVTHQCPKCGFTGSGDWSPKTNGK